MSDVVVHRCACSPKRRTVQEVMADGRLRCQRCGSKQAAAGYTAEVRLDEIVVGRRYRKDAGDIPALAGDVEQHGLLHLIVVTPTRLLVCGWRRLLALQHLGREKALVHVLDCDVTLAEWVENEYREQLLPSELAELAIALRGYAMPKIGRPRKGEDPPQTANEIYQQVGDKAGISVTSVRQAVFVTEAAKRDPSVDPFRRAMDQTGHIHTAYRAVRSLGRQQKSFRMHLSADEVALVVRLLEQHPEADAVRKKIAECRQRWLDPFSTPLFRRVGELLEQEVPLARIVETLRAENVPSNRGGRVDLRAVKYAADRIQRHGAPSTEVSP